MQRMRQVGLVHAGQRGSSSSAVPSLRHQVAPHDFRHAARLVDCFSALVHSLAPVMPSVQLRPQDSALAAVLLEAGVVVEACSMVQRLVPRDPAAPHSIADSPSHAWGQPVHVGGSALPLGRHTVRSVVTQLAHQVLMSVLQLTMWVDKRAVGPMGQLGLQHRAVAVVRQQGSRVALMHLQLGVQHQAAAVHGTTWQGGRQPRALHPSWTRSCCSAVHWVQGGQ